MPSHRIYRARHYRISDDVLITILEFCDPRDLYNACKVFRRVYALVMELQPLRFKYELALTGMKDGLVPYAARPPRLRLQLLLSYRNDWPRLAWSHEMKVKIVTPSQVGVSGSFLHQIRSHGNYATLELTELPSARTGRTPAMTRHIKHTSPPIDVVFIDPSQSLLVTGHAFRSQGDGIAVQLTFRDLWTFSKHRKASSPVYELVCPTDERLRDMALQLCGSKLAVSLQFKHGGIRHLLIEWRTLSARWLDDQDIHFLNENYLLTTKEIHGYPYVTLYNVARVKSIAPVREYELPEDWAGSAIGFSQNLSPKMDSTPNPDALFQTDPATRLVLIMSKPRSRSTHHGVPEWLFINETVFRPPMRKELARVPWNYWSHDCLIRTQPSALKQGPCVVGNKVLYLSTVPFKGHKGEKRGAGCVNAIDFAPFPDSSSTRPASSWIWFGSKCTLFPTETARFPSNIPGEDGYEPEVLTATEDNIVLFNEVRHNYRPVKILTFGVPN